MEDDVILNEPSKTVRVSPVRAECAYYTLFVSDNAKAEATRRSYCLVSAMAVEKKNALTLPDGRKQTQNVATLLHIWTVPDERRNGYARDVLSAVKEHMDAIYAEPLTPEVKKLLMATGFIKAKDGDLFRWVKK
jgi:hypothetical protein